LVIFIDSFSKILVKKEVWWMKYRTIYAICNAFIFQIKRKFIAFKNLKCLNNCFYMPCIFLLLFAPVFIPSASALKNPSAVYCEELGYNYNVIMMQDDASSQDGICIISPQVRLNAWDFFEGRIGQEHSYCEKNNLAVQITEGGKYSSNEALCVPKSGDIASVSVSLADYFQMSEKLNSNLDVDIKSAIDINTVQSATLSSQSDDKGGVLLTQLPSYFDWRNNGGNWLTPVKNQGSCGSCWAFAAVGAVEAAYNKNSNDPTLDINLAEQDLVSCAFPQGCSGGDFVTALDHIKNKGITEEAYFPYLGYDAQCSKNSGWNNNLWAVSDADYTMAYTNFNNEQLKEWLIEKGPLPIAIHVYHGSGDTSGFVNSLYACDDRYDRSLNHAVLLVGYNDTGLSSTSYWIIKNSWGVSWNKDGYFKVRFNECGVGSYVHFVAEVNPPSSGESSSCEELETRLAALESQNLATRISLIEDWKSTFISQISLFKDWLFYPSYSGMTVCEAIAGECSRPIPKCSKNLDCNDFNACTDDYCIDPGTENAYCLNENNHASCDNGIFCDGPDACRDGSCTNVGPAVACDSSMGCMDYSCDETLKECIPMPNHAFCDNGIYCDGVELCSLESTWESGCVPGTPVECNDNNSCTVDSCNNEMESCDFTFSYSLCECQKNSDCSSGKTCTNNKCVEDYNPQPCTEQGAWLRCGQQGCYGVSVCSGDFWTACSSKGSLCQSVGTCSSSGVCII
jgi:C1A family cysteine protease